MIRLNTLGTLLGNLSLTSLMRTRKLRLLQTVRRITLGLFLILGAGYSQITQALSLGDIEVYSALNQPLVAEIALSSLEPDEAEAIIINLASETAFSQAGLDRPFYLTQLKFSLATKPDGTYYIKVISQGPLREPFLNFLVDVDWPRGRLLREYTILLDPPVFTTTPQTAAPVAPAVSSLAPVPVTDDLAGESAPIEREPTPTPVQEQSLTAADLPEFEELSEFDELPEAEPLAVTEASEAATDPVASETIPGIELEPELEQLEAEAATLALDEFSEAEFESLAAEPLVEEQTVESLPDIDLLYDPSLPYDEAATSAILAEFPAGASIETGGIDEPDLAGDAVNVEAGETLWGIAARSRDPKVSVQQAMLAFLQYNPEAFHRGNINQLKKGVVLRIPDAQAMAAISTADAIAEVSRQNALWQEYKNQLAEGTVDAENVEDFTESSFIDDEGVVTAETDTGQLALLAPGRDADATDDITGEQEGVAGGTAAEINLQLAREQLQAERLEKMELQERLDDLSGQLETMQRIISVQDEQLASLQRQLAEVTEQAVEPTVAEPNLVIETPADELIDEPSEPQPDSPTEDALAVAEPEILPEALPDPADLAATPSTEDPLLIEDSPPGGSEPVSEPEPEPEIVEQPVEAEPFDFLPSPLNRILADLLASPLQLGLVILAIIAVIGGLIALKFKSKAASTQPIIGETTTPEQPISLLQRILSKLPFAKKSTAEKTATDLPAAASEKTLSQSEDVTQAMPEAEVDVDLDEAVVVAQEDTDSAEPRAEQEAVVEDMLEIDLEDDLGDDEADDEAGKSEVLAEEEIGESTELELGIPDSEIVQESAEESDDTTAEADVYLAYGLFDQAEELLQQALEANPNKAEYQGKLLETYFAAGKKEEFEQLAADLSANLAGKSSRIWDKAVAMGKEIAPDNELFSTAPDSGLKAADFVSAKPEAADVDLGESAAPVPDIEFVDEDDAEEVLPDFKLSIDDTLVGPEIEPEPEDTEEPDFADIDFAAEDLGLGDATISSIEDIGPSITPEPEPESEDAFAAATELAELGEIEDFDPDDDDAEPTLVINADELGVVDDIEDSPDSLSATTNFGDDALAADLDELNVDQELHIDQLADMDEDDEVATLSAADDLISELDMDDLDDLETASEETEFAPVDDTLLDAEADLFGDGDETLMDVSFNEVATKLDLAQAYIDMGDKEGAKAALDEVLAEGDESQRHQAEELSRQIA